MLIGEFGSGTDHLQRHVDSHVNEGDMAAHTQLQYNPHDMMCNWDWDYDPNLVREVFCHLIVANDSTPTI